MKYAMSFFAALAVASNDNHHGPRKGASPKGSIMAKERIYDFLVPIVGWTLVLTVATVAASFGLFLFYAFTTFLFLS